MDVYFNKMFFLTGLPRSGSKLIENILRKCPSIDYKSIDESYYFGRFICGPVSKNIKKIGNMSLDVNIYKLVDYFSSNKLHGNFWKNLEVSIRQKGKEKLLDKLLNSDRSERGIYQALIQFQISIERDTIIGDKSGPHVFHIPEILKLFPEAKIIHHYRDPRAILVSELSRSKKSFLPLPKFLLKSKRIYSIIKTLHILITWIIVSKLHYIYEKRYQHSYLRILFEDLVLYPEPNIKNMCKFLEIEYHPNMLTPEQWGSSFVNDNSDGFDIYTLTRWQSKLKTWMKLLIWIFGKKHLRMNGYDKNNVINC